MSDISRVIIIIGIILIILGVFLTFIPKIPFIGKLPGDFLITKDGFTFYFPLATSILISIILTILFKLFGRK